MNTTTTARSATIAFNPILRMTPAKFTEFTVDLTAVPESVLGDILVAGARVLMTNAFNSGGAETPEAARLDNVKKRIAAWNRGEYALTNTGPRESIIGEMKEAFINKQVALGKTVKEAEASIRDTVTRVFGKDDKATFARFLDAVATIKAKADDSVTYDVMRAALEADAMKAVEAARVAKAKADAELNDLDIEDLF